MNKEQLLQELSTKISTGEIRKEEIMSRLGVAAGMSGMFGVPTQTNEKHSARFSVTKLLYSLGAIVVVVGIVIFVGQIWDDLATFGRVSITLGLGVLFAAIGSFLLISKPGNTIGTIFHFIGGMLIPGGSIVMLYELHLIETSFWPMITAFGIISLFYILLNLFHKNVILTFFTVANATAFVYLLFLELIKDSSYVHNDLIAYLTIVIGASYLLLAYAFREGWNKKLFSVLCFFGSMGVLGAGFSQVFDSTLWQLFYFVLVFGGFFLSIYLKDRSILAVSTIFLIAHVSYITGEYFADSVGWPISLVVLGFVFIGLGYGAVAINKKYIKQ